MIKPEHKELLAQLGANQFGKALRAFLDEKVWELQSVRNASDWEDVKGKQKALKIIDELFYFMKEKKEITKDKNPYV